MIIITNICSFIFTRSIVQTLKKEETNIAQKKLNTFKKN